MVKLSKRLKCVADMVTGGNAAADIGCDHAYIPVYLVQQKICPKVIAMDVNKEPLQKAKEHIRDNSLEDYIEPRLSDGACALFKGEAETLICAGLGGRLMIRILQKSHDKIAHMKELILQPQSAWNEVRRYLRMSGFLIDNEKMIAEDGKYYVILHVLPGFSKDIHIAQEDDISDLENYVYDSYGRHLLERKDAVLFSILQKEYNTCRIIQEKLLLEESEKERFLQRKMEIGYKIEGLVLALGYYKETEETCGNNSFA